MFLILILYQSIVLYSYRTTLSLIYDCYAIMKIIFYIKMYNSINISPHIPKSKRKNAKLILENLYYKSFIYNKYI